MNSPLHRGKGIKKSKMCLRNIWMALSDKMANDFEEEFVADVSEGDDFLNFLSIFYYYFCFLFKVTRIK